MLAHRPNPLSTVRLSEEKRTKLRTGCSKGALLLLAMLAFLRLPGSAAAASNRLKTPIQTPLQPTGSPGCLGGSVYFNNYVPGVIDQRLTFNDCDILSGPDWKAQLCLYSPTNALVPLGSALSFLSGTNSGYLDTSGESIVSVPGTVPQQTVSVLVRFWHGGSVEEAITNGLVSFSTVFTVQLGGGLGPPAV